MGCSKQRRGGHHINSRRLFCFRYEYFSNQSYGPRCLLLESGRGASAPTAAATDAYLAPNWETYITVSPGQKISAFSATVQTVSITEITG
jgi:hypothetical protein